MNARVLLVDDDVNVLQGYKRALRNRFTLDLAEGGEQALRMAEQRGPYSVVVSDMRMPEMHGVELLSRFRSRYPDTVRLMLTGNADQQTAIDAINVGDIFRFLNKPCPSDILLQAIAAGIEQHRLITAEKELLRNTLAGSIKVLAEVLSLANPEAFGRTSRLRSVVKTLTDELGIENEWWLDPLVLLSQIGSVTLPEGVSKKIAAGQPMTEDEWRQYRQHPVVGADLLSKIPRLEDVSQAIRFQDHAFDGSGAKAGLPKGADLPLGSRLLKLALDYDYISAAGVSPAGALSHLERSSAHYDPDMLDALRRVVKRVSKEQIRNVHIWDLEDGMVLAEDVRTHTGLLLVARGHRMTPSVRQRLDNYHHEGHVDAAVQVVVPPEMAEETGSVVGA